MDSPSPLSGTTRNGVPFVAIPPESQTDSTPVVIAWHLMDPPRTEAAMAAALPLAGLDAWKVYLGLPMSGGRMPAGGAEELMGLAMQDAPLLVHGLIFRQSVAEFDDAFDELRTHLGIAETAPVGLLGGSMGSAIAAGVLASGTSGARAAVLVSPMLQLRPMIDEVSAMFGASYAWTPPADKIAARMDFVARAPEVAASGCPVRIVVGADDLPAFIDAAAAFAEETGADVRIVEGAGHALAEEPGIEPAPQSAAAREFDALATEWLRQHLT